MRPRPGGAWLAAWCGRRRRAWVPASLPVAACCHAATCCSRALRAHAPLLQAAGGGGALHRRQLHAAGHAAENQPAVCGAPRVRRGCGACCQALPQTRYSIPFLLRVPALGSSPGLILHGLDFCLPGRVLQYYDCCCYIVACTLIHVFKKECAIGLQRCTVGGSCVAWCSLTDQIGVRGALVVQ